MRATMGTTYRSLLGNLNRINSRLEELRVQTASGKKLQRPSNDPSAIRPTLYARADIVSANRFTRTINAGIDRIDNQDYYLDNMENILVRAKEISIAAVNDSLNAEDRLTYANEVAQLRKELFDMGNAQFDGKYLFSGHQIHTRPFVENPAYDPVNDPRPVLYNGDNGAFNLATGPGEVTRVNITGNALLLGDADNDGVTDPDGTDVFGVMKRLEDALRNNDSAAIEAEMSGLESSMEQVRRHRSIMGNNGSRLEEALGRMENMEIRMREILSRYEDADLVETIANLKKQESALQAALAVTGRISELSILNYL
ncbi:flagellar hook-associated protein 3 FlgL [Geothermobacter ehrlichii]|uniref:Flagellar hook-associated protein 3 FlgL n=1 Tax=Geothermobacter ehrlichii TaxID=213224 RepID=A0A5D3WRF3_9BACT|nr:flagellar hook-associated protein FlgL [Geothermobacter ehrlichii]TYP00179.1 flagellar hook-associated protein 3 FlgL [Geothermobacter ehrlichii]